MQEFARFQNRGRISHLLCDRTALEPCLRWYSYGPLTVALCTGEQTLKRISKFALMLAAAVAVLALPAFAGQIVVRTPEPSSIMLLASGVGGILILRRLRK